MEREKNLIFIPIILGLILIIFGIILSSWKLKLKKEIARKPTEIVEKFKECGTAKEEESRTSINEVFSCLGKSLYQDCQNAKGTLQNSNWGPVTIEIKKESSGECTLRINFPPSENIPEPHFRKFGNSWIECPVKKSFEELIEVQDPATSKKLTFEELLNRGKEEGLEGVGPIFFFYYKTLYFSLSKNKAKEIKCQGSFIENLN